jgi:beta-lactamase class A
LLNMGQAIALNRDKPDVVAAPKLAFEADALDKAAPKAMLRFLVMLAEGDLLDKQHTDCLLDVMSRTVTGPDRIKGLLPQGTPVAHKTGSIGGVANDVGYITLPDKRRLAIVVFTKSSQTAPPQRERAIAEVARTLFEYYAASGR